MSQKTTTSSRRLIFLDVGGHRGQTLDEVLSERYRFDVVHSFEPHPTFAAGLRERFAEEIRTGHLIVHEFGLADTTGTATLYGSNEGGGASLYDEAGTAQAGQQLDISLRRATDFFDTSIAESDFVVMKLNCEGAEGPLLTDLANSGAIHRVGHTMIDFDLFKYPGRRSEPFQVLKLLRQVGFDRFNLVKEVMVGPTHAQRIRNWLALVHQKQPLFSDVASIPLPREGSALKQQLRMWKYRALAAIERPAA